MTKANQMLISLKDISEYKMATHTQMKSDSKEEFTKQNQILKTCTGTSFCSKWFTNTAEENLWPGELNYACRSSADVFTVLLPILIVPAVLSFLSNELIALN